MSSRSPTPPRSSRAPPRKRKSSSSLSSRSRSQTPINDRIPTGRSIRSPSYDSDDRRDEKRTNSRKARPKSPPSRSRSRDRLSPVPATRSKSPSPARQRDRKRHRSIQRYAPVARRRPNTSSESSPADKRRKMADSSADEGSRHNDTSKNPITAEPSAIAGANDEVGGDP